MKQFEGKTVLVTGASKGIGADIAREFARRGAKVAVNYASSREGGEAVVQTIAKEGGEAFAVGCDVGKTAQVDAMFKEIEARFGHLDILVNNAGRYLLGPLASVTEKNFRANFDPNVLGVLLVTQRALPLFPASGGSIVNIGSAVSTLPNPMTLTYGASKAALNYITKTLSIELGPRNIRVNAILPGVVETEGAHDAGSMDPNFQKLVISRTPLGRIAQPEDISLIAAYLASDEARWLTGESMMAAGGLY